MRLGHVVATGLPNISSAGLFVDASMGVALKCSSALLISVLVSVHFFIRCFAVCTVRSARPFDFGWYGLEGVCLMSQSFMKFWKSDPLNCGPLSETISLGAPNRAHVDLNTFATCFELRELSSATIGNFEK